MKTQKQRLMPWYKRGANARKNPGDWMEDLFELTYEHAGERRLSRWLKRQERRYHNAIMAGC